MDLSFDSEPLQGSGDGEAGWHLSALFFALVRAILSVLESLATLILINQFTDWGYKGTAGGLIVTLLLKTLHWSIFDWANFGRLRFIPLNLLQLRPFVDFCAYFLKWKTMINLHWSGRMVCCCSQHPSLTL